MRLPSISSAPVYLTPLISTSMRPLGSALTLARGSEVGLSVGVGVEAEEAAKAGREISNFMVSD